MSSKENHVTNPCKVDLWNIQFSQQIEQLDVHRSLLRANELERAARFKNPALANAYISTRGTLRQILAAHLNTEPADLRFERSEHGKPYLPNSDVHFNLSHSKDRLLIAVSNSGPIGVDVEFRKPNFNYNAIAQRWFSPAENQHLRTHENPSRAFFDLWTKKEAYVKALGQGIFHELNCFTVPLNESANEPLNGWAFQSLTIDPAYAAALVTQAPKKQLRIHRNF